MTDTMHIHEPTGPLTVAYTDRARRAAAGCPSPTTRASAGACRWASTSIASAVDALAGVRRRSARTATASATRRPPAPTAPRSRCCGPRTTAYTPW